MGKGKVGNGKTNARLWNDRVTKEGAQIQLGGNESYVALCRKHWAEGKTGPEAAQ
ncbi:MAG: hypothetical protein IK099_03015 [Clostridia bacterium]|nr:hypothetical protein [Clostridia bacterium]